MWCEYISTHTMECIHTQWCIFKLHEKGHFVTTWMDLEEKFLLVLIFLAPSYFPSC